MKFSPFNLLELSRFLIARWKVCDYLSQAKKEGVNAVKFRLCPKNEILQVYYDSDCVGEHFSQKSLIHIFDDITSVDRMKDPKFKFQRAEYSNKEGTVTGVFDVVTIPVK
jgi:hypothetical protein